MRPGMNSAQQGEALYGKVEEIFDIITTHGIRQVPDVRLQPSKMTEFIRGCHVGFGKGQDAILTELLSIENQKAVLKKQASQRDTRPVTKLLDYYCAVFRKLADTIAWQLIGMSDFLARRLYVSSEQPHLGSSNYQSTKAYVDSFNRQHPLGFALMTDLTSFVRIGDVLELERNEEGGPALRFVELKEGPVNHELLKAVLQLYAHPCSRYAYFLVKDYDEKRVKHILRLARQVGRNAQAVALMHGEDVPDPIDGDRRLVVDVPMEYSSYDDVLDLVVSEARQHGNACTIIDGCLHIAAARTGPMQEQYWKAWIGRLPHSSTLVRPESLRKGFLMPLAHPLFLRQLGRDHILDLTSMKMTVVMTLNVDKFLELGNAAGARGYWVPKPRVARQAGVAPITDNHGRVAVFEHAGKRMGLVAANLAQVFFNGVTPSSFVSNAVSVLAAT